jgi:hypothetical protein
MMRAQILGSVVMAAFFAGAVGCNRTADESVMRDDTIVTETASGTTSSADSVSGTTANDPATAPNTMDNSGAVPPTDTNAASGDTAASGATTTTTTETKSKKATKKKHHDKKAHKGAWHQQHQSSDEYVYEDNSVLTDDNAVYGQTDIFTEDETVSGTTLGASTAAYDDGGLSPFAQEPTSRIGANIGSNQITGKDKSISSLEDASVFQDPIAQERDRLNK